MKLTNITIIKFISMQINDLQSVSYWILKLKKQNCYRELFEMKERAISEYNYNS